MQRGVRAGMPQRRLSRALVVLMGIALVLTPVLVMRPWGPVAAAHAATAERASLAAAQQAFSKQQRVGFQSGDDWESSLVTDRFGHVYVMYKHYDVVHGQTCSGCNLHMLIQRSDDDGVTWSAPRMVAPGKVFHSGQDDAQLAVDPVDGRTLYAAFMEGYPKASIVVVKSTDFGETWSPEVSVSDRPPTLDKDTLLVHGQEVAIAYDDGENTWASISFDGGITWATHEIFPADTQFGTSLSAGGGIDSHGNIFFSWNSFDAAHATSGDGPVTLWVSKSSDQGQHWTRTIIGTSGAPYPCDSCGFAYLSAQDAMAIGADDTVYVLYNGTSDMTDFAPERIYLVRSTDGGQTYSARVDVSDAPAGVEHCFPALTVGARPGDLRLSWMDERTGAWNVFYRRSPDGGQTFAPTVRVSSYVPGYSYLTADGFTLPYGDYYQLSVDQNNQTQMTFGEGPSWIGPGNIWVAHSI
ncbi:MAG: sialidase family protein [Nitrososphaerota archaeon]